jgi:hypothetical protein
MLAVLVMAKSAVGLTVSVAITVLEFAPTEVDKEPEGIVLVTCGETPEQFAPGGINVPAGNVKLLPPDAATGVDDKQVVATNDGLALTNPDWYWSMKGVLKVAETNWWVLVNVITNKDVPPAGIVDGEKVFETVGKLALTVSTSTAEQTPVPEIQKVEVLVLVTPLGGSIVAVLVTDVCARTNWETKNSNATPSALKQALRARTLQFRKKIIRSQT